MMRQSSATYGTASCSCWAGLADLLFCLVRDVPEKAPLALQVFDEDRDEEDGENGDDTDSRRIAARYHVFDDMSSFMPRVPLVPEKGWYPLTLDKVEGKDKSSVMSAMESDTRKLRIEIQFRDGWHSAGWITQFTDKVCAEHSQNYKGWVWVSVVFEGEATQQYYLCDLDDTMYGMDSHSSWCVLKRNQ